MQQAPQARFENKIIEKARESNQRIVGSGYSANGY